MNSIAASGVAESDRSVHAVADAPLPVICGPTAAGKSALAMALAREAPVTIISADSRQLYRGFDIGTAKPTRAEQAMVPHAGIDVAEATERWSAWKWAEMAWAAIHAARAAGRVPVVVGGTGFYVRALVAPLAPLPPLDPERRAALARWLDAQPPTEWHRLCARLDPPRAALGPPQWRRAIEVALLTGTPISVWHRQAPGPGGRVPSVHYLVVDPGAALADRIAARVHAMIAAGWLEEVRALRRHVPDDAPAWQATGYAVLRDLIAQGTEHDEAARRGALERIITDTRQYAKRQRTWWRHQLRERPVTRLSPDEPDAPARVRAWWRHLTEAVQ
jgi:tRNA dimethylallyltransferase